MDEFWEPSMGQTDVREVCRHPREQARQVTSLPGQDETQA